MNPISTDLLPLNSLDFQYEKMNYYNKVKAIYKVVLSIKLGVITKLSNTCVSMIIKMFINFLIKLRLLILSRAKKNTLQN